MRLNFEQIKRITTGAVRIWEENDQICFSKMTERQLDAFAALSQGLYERACTTTGVRLELYTTSRTVTVGSYRNGEYRERTFVPQPRAGERGGFVSVVLASHERETLAFVELEDGSTLCPCDYDTKMVFFGDSITQGWHSTDDALSYAYLVSRHFNADSIIQGIGGAYYHPSTADQLDFDPDTVIVAYGTNDASGAKSVEEVERNCKAYLALIKEYYPASRIFVITPLWRRDYDKPRVYGHVQEISDAIRDVARSLSLPVIDGLTLMPHDEALLTDDVHPGDAGFAHYAKNLIFELERA